MRKQINSQMILLYKIYLLNKHTSVLNLFFIKKTNLKYFQKTTNKVTCPNRLI